MNKITLAIPFYNTSQYFTDCIKYALDNDFVDEIVVNDETRQLIQTLHLRFRDLRAILLGVPPSR